MGERRLARLSEDFDLTVERSFLEIHPETPPGGMPVSRLGYTPERWAKITANLARMGAEEGIAFAERNYTTNSHKALLLAEAIREHSPEKFEALNESLFKAYFTEGKNIGDEAVLRGIAREAGIPDETVERAWSDPAYEERLRKDREAAERYGITGIPVFVFEDQLAVEGAVPTETLHKAALEVAASL